MGELKTKAEKKEEEEKCPGSRGQRQLAASWPGPRSTLHVPWGLWNAEAASSLVSRWLTVRFVNFHTREG